jgi:hypothetical protein
MLPIRLQDMALLRCSYSERFVDEEEQQGEEGTPSDAGGESYPDEQLLKLAVTADAEDGEVVCFIEGKLDDERLPFELSFEMGFLYVINGDEPLPKIETLQPTLVWLAFPHLREFVAELTGRSPSSRYFVPPLTRLPQPDAQSSGSEQTGAADAELAE